MIDFYETLPFGFVLLKGRNFIIKYINVKASAYISKVNLETTVDYLKLPESLMEKIRFSYNNNQSVQIKQVLYNNSFYDIVINSINDDTQLFIYDVSDKIIDDVISTKENHSEVYVILNTVLHSLKRAVFITDTSGKIIYKNLKANEIINKAKCNGNNIYGFVASNKLFYEDKTMIDINRFPVYKSIKMKQEIKSEILTYKEEDMDKYISMDSYPIIKDGLVIAAVLTIKDITKEHYSSMKIRDEREKFLSISTELKTKCDIIEILRNKEKEHLMHLKDVINNISEGIIVFDANEKISLCNKSINKILDIKLIDLLDIKNLTEKYIIANADNEGENPQRLYHYYFKNNLPIRNTVLKFISKKSKKIKYIEINSNPIYNNSKLTYTIYTIKDITENKMHQLNSEEQADFIKNVVNTLDIPLVVIDYPDLKFKLINRKYDELFKHCLYQFKIDDILGDGLRNVLPGYENNDIYNILKSVGEEKKSVTYSPYVIKDTEGNDRYYKLKFIPYIYNEDKVRIHIHGSDITEEINHNMELEKLNKMKDEFFTIISHELRTPLTIIYSSLQLAYDIYGDEITENINKTLGRINQNCSRLLKLINNILDISKAEAGFLSLNNTEFDIVNQSEAIVNSANFYAQNKNIDLIFDTNEEECSVLLDKDKYEKVLLNILSNAIKFTSEGKQILVSLNIQDEFFYLIVKDQGIGIPENKINYIFDRFAQVNSSLSRRAEGTGLGLALVKKIVELMSGNIEVHSEYGKGTEFIIKFKKEASFSENSSSHVIIGEDMNDKINIEFSDIS